jgi:hypothetical protein
VATTNDFGIVGLSPSPATAAQTESYAPPDMPAYRLYVLAAERLKLFDENELGPGVFVNARVGRDRQPVWERTDVYAEAE